MKLKKKKIIVNFMHIATFYLDYHTVHLTDS